MTIRKLLQILVALLLIFVVAVGLISINHPIIIKWLSGTARHIGKPITATVYTNGQINNDIKVFHVDKYWKGGRADYYIIYVPYADKSRLKFFSLNKKDNYAGCPVSTNIRDYDLIAGHLFQFEDRRFRRGADRFVAVHGARRQEDRVPDAAFGPNDERIHRMELPGGLRGPWVVPHRHALVVEQRHRVAGECGTVGLHDLVRRPIALQFQHDRPERIVADPFLHVRDALELPLNPARLRGDVARGAVGIRDASIAGPVIQAGHVVEMTMNARRRGGLGPGDIPYLRPGVVDQRLGAFPRIRHGVGLALTGEGQQ